jgi:DNA-binding MarR family transcriptional regulator
MIKEAIDVTTTAERLRPVLLRLSRELRKETEALGVTGRQAALLWLVREHPGLTLTELAELERISAPSLSAHVDRLERADLLERIRSSDDRRRVGLQLTPAGSALVRRVRSRRTTWLARRLAALDDAQIEAVDRAIGPLTALLSEDDA